MECKIKTMLEAWSSIIGVKILEYHFIRNDGSHYTVSVLEEINGNVFVTLYWVELNDYGCRITEIE